MIEYRFTFESKKEIVFKVNRERRYTPEIDRVDHPRWTKLAFRRCPNCTLPEKEFQHCPPAVDMKEIIQEFASADAREKVTVTVSTPERRYIQTCDVQTGLNSLLGLVFATSACPYLSKLSSLAKFHLPFATVSESLYRAVGNYLIKQYLAKKRGETPDFELFDLERLYGDLETVNMHLNQRISQISEGNASLSAISNFFQLSNIVRFSISDQLKEFKDVF